MKGAWVDAERVGIFPTVGQSIEDRHGEPIRVTADNESRNNTELRRNFPRFRS